MGILKIAAAGIVLTFVCGVAARAENARDYLNGLLRSPEGATDDSTRRLSRGTLLLPDDPANAALYERLEGHIRGLDKEIGNTSDMLYYYGFLEALLGHLIEIFQRIRELAHFSTGPWDEGSGDSPAAAELESQLAGAVSLLRNADFNGKKIFTPLADDAALASLLSADPAGLPSNVDKLLAYFISARSWYGAKVRLLESRRRSAERRADEAGAFQSTVFDIDYAAEMSALKKNQLLLLAHLFMIEVKAER